MGSTFIFIFVKREKWSKRTPEDSGTEYFSDKGLPQIWTRIWILTSWLALVCFSDWMKECFYSLKSSNSASHPFLTKNELQIWTQAPNSLYPLVSSFLTYLSKICLAHFFVIPQQTQPRLCVIFFLSLRNRCWAQLLLWFHRKQTSGCASTPYSSSYSSVTAHPFVKEQDFLIRVHCDFWKQQPYVMHAAIPSCSRVTNVTPTWQSITNAFPTRELNTTCTFSHWFISIYFIKNISEREKK